jgi:hypothetical protein
LINEQIYHGIDLYFAPLLTLPYKKGFWLSDNKATAIITTARQNCFFSIFEGQEIGESSPKNSKFS